jgi:uncharacterized cupin superfamily protein
MILTVLETPDWQAGMPVLPKILCSKSRQNAHRVLQPARMTRTQAEDLPWTQQNSPQGKYALARRSLSVAAGGQKDIGTWGGGHPFDVEIQCIMPGKVNFPFHEHSAQWEAYYILSGSGQVRTPKGKEAVKAGDYLVFPPGEAHQIINNGSEDLTFFVIANQPQADVIHYPDSGKWMTKPHKKSFEMQEVEYFKGEE